jgi:hypothetical protein
MTDTRKAPDQSFFIVTRDYGKLGFESVTDPDATRDSVINDIASGQIDRVAYVIECNPVEGWAHDITADINEAVADRLIKAA